TMWMPRPRTPGCMSEASTSKGPAGLPAVLQEADLVAHRLGELVVAGMLGGHGVRAAHARVVRAELRPEHGKHEQPERAEREPERAEHDAAHGTARPGRAVAPRPPARHRAEPDRHG